MGLFNLFKMKEKSIVCSCCNREISKGEIKKIGSNIVCGKCVEIYDKIVALKNSIEPNKKPSEPLIIKQTVLEEINPDNSAAFSFEKNALIIEIVLEEQRNQEYVRITNYKCYAENNGRPQYSMSKSYYELSQVDLENISSDNYKQKINGKPIYEYTEYDWGCVY